jgi:hypothetical protein
MAKRAASKPENPMHLILTADCFGRTSSCFNCPFDSRRKTIVFKKIRHACKKELLVSTGTLFEKKRRQEQKEYKEKKLETRKLCFILNLCLGVHSA